MAPATIGGMSATYDKFQVRFYYPENWSIIEEQADDWPRTVTVQSPGTAFWSLHVYQPAVSPLELAGEVVQTMREEYPDLDVTTESHEVAGQATAGYDMDFHCLDLIVHARVLGIVHGERTFLLMFQAEDAEFERLEQVFLAITTSLLQFSDPAGEADWDH